MAYHIFNADWAEMKCFLFLTVYMQNLDGGKINVFMQFSYFYFFLEQENDHKNHFNENWFHM